MLSSIALPLSSIVLYNLVLSCTITYFSHIVSSCLYNVFNRPTFVFHCPIFSPVVSLSSVPCYFLPSCAIVYLCLPSPFYQLHSLLLFSFTSCHLPLSSNISRIQSISTFCLLLHIIVLPGLPFHPIAFHYLVLSDIAPLNPFACIMSCLVIHNQPPLYSIIYCSPPSIFHYFIC